MTILKDIEPNPCHDKKCDMPPADLAVHGAGTIAACSRCGRQARLEIGGQMDGAEAIWVWLTPDDYVTVGEAE